MSENVTTRAECLELGDVPPIGEGPLSLSEWLVFPAYVISIVLMLFGPEITFGGRLPHPLSTNVYAPVCGVIYLFLVHFLTGGAVEPLMTGAILVDVIKEKFDIVLLIFSFAYLAISLDKSNFFKWSALRVILWSNGDGKKLFRFNYLLCSILTFFTSNDVVTLAMTPILVHLGNFSGIKNMIPLLVSAFVAANTASAGLYIGSPTNIILGDAAGLTFVDYLIYMFIPTLALTLTTLLMLEIVFIHFPVDKSTVMQLEFEPLTKEKARLMLYENLHQQQLPIEEIVKDQEEGTTVTEGDSGAAAASFNELVLDKQTQVDVAGQDGSDTGTAVDLQQHSEKVDYLLTFTAMYVKVGLLSICLIFLTISSYIGVELWIISTIASIFAVSYDIYLVYKSGDNVKAFMLSVADRMPWEVAPYVFAMFSMVNVITDVGFTGRFAVGMTKAAGPNAVTASLSFGFISALMVNLLCDLPSTVFWADTLRILCDFFPEKTYLTILYALLVGNNVGCYLTTVGALAGLMWMKILRTTPGSENIITPRPWDLTRFAVIIIGPVTLVGCLVVAAEIEIIY